MMLRPELEIPKLTHSQPAISMLPSFTCLLLPCGFPHNAGMVVYTELRVLLTLQHEWLCTRFCSCYYSSAQISVYYWYCSMRDFVHEILLMLLILQQNESHSPRHTRAWTESMVRPEANSTAHDPVAAGLQDHAA